MPDSQSLTIFVLAVLVLAITPGPAVLYIVARSLDQGRLAGLVSVLGIGLGALVHVVAAALGLSALLLSSALAFSALKYAGAAYLVYIGVRNLLAARDEAAALTPPARASLSRIFVQGMVVNLLNPKTALFFLAFLPQFVDPGRGSVTVQFVSLGLLFTMLAMTTDALYALLAGTLGRGLQTNPRVRRHQQYLAGGVYIGLGLATALSGSHKK
jgi:threonine/homoserine/homoserine lactone efflux protein